MITNLVTGGAGFIGSNLAKKLIKLNQKVICIDNLSSGDLNNIKEISNSKNFSFVNHDILNSIEFKVDRIWHFACPASPLNYQNDPLETAKINFLGTLNMLELAKKYSAKFLFSSSSEIYGNPLNSPIQEDSIISLKTNSVRSCYSEGKRIAETLCFDYQRKFNLNIKVARIFNTYGPNLSLKDGRIIGSFLDSIIENRPLTIFGNGKQTRSFCYIEDLLEGLILLMESDYKGPINFGFPKQTSIIGLGLIIEQLVKKKLQYTYKEAKEDDPQIRLPSIKLANEILGWKPKVDLNMGLKQTLISFTNRI